MQTKHLIIGVNLILIALWINLGVGFFYRALTAGFAVANPVAVAVDHSNRPLSREIRPAIDDAAILTRNLFGVTLEENAKPAVPVAIEDLKPTALQLKLWGTVLHEKGTAFAIIEDLKTRRQQLYKPGDTVEGATIKEILREKVVLSVGDRDEMLEMASEKTGGPGAPQGAMFGGNSGAERIPVSRQEITAATQNVGHFLGQVGIRPHLENGRPNGLQLTRVRSDSLFHRLGLASGDVLVGVDGKPIRSVNDLINLYQKMNASREVRVQIQRNGQTHNMDFVIQ